MYDAPAYILNETSDFSIVRGGPFYRLLCASRLCDNQFHYTYRRAALIAMIAWLPLLTLSLFESRALGGIEIPFVNDIETHVRLLVALPMLLIGESFVHRVLAGRMKGFLVRDIVQKKDLSRFNFAVRSAFRWRDSPIVEGVILLIVLAVGRMFFINIASASAESHTWYASPVGVHWNLTSAGYWLTFVSLPIFQFLLVRWYFRLIVWFILLFRISRLDLNLIPTHSDRTGGIAFLSKCLYGFSGFLVAQGALLSGYIAGQAFNKGRSPLSFKLEAAVLTVALVGCVLAPLAVFANKLRIAKWSGAEIYGNIVSRYVRDFDDKWVKNKRASTEELLGTGDIQSLADITNSYSVVGQMKVFPFAWNDVVLLSIMTVAPLAPLVLFVFSPEEVLDRLLKILL